MYCNKTVILILYLHDINLRPGVIFTKTHNLVRILALILNLQISQRKSLVIELKLQTIPNEH